MAIDYDGGGTPKHIAKVSGVLWQVGQNEIQVAEFSTIPAECDHALSSIGSIANNSSCGLTAHGNLPNSI